MSNLPQQNTIIQYDADGSTNAFPFPYYVPLETDIAAYVTLSGEDPIPEDDIKVLNTDYTVSFNSDITTGGFVTFLTGKTPPSGSVVTLSRDVAASLDVEFANATTFSGANLDDALDRLLLLIQQNKTLINSSQQRVLSYRVNAFQADSNIVSNTQIPVLSPNQVWIGSGDGVTAVDLEENPDVSVLRGQLADNQPGTDGARLVGYYDTVNSAATTVQAFLANLSDYIIENLLIMPSGAMVDFGGTVAPSGWLLCDGSAVSRTTYDRLFTAIGTTWGTGDGSTTFNLPDFRRRTAVGSGGSGSGTLGNAVGNVGGEETHTLTIAEMPAHDHPGSSFRYQAVNTGTGGIPTLGSDSLADRAVTVASQGGGNPHNVMQPSAVVLKIIKY